jgi:hypothetical protein
VGLVVWITALLVLDHDGPLERQVLLGVATVAVLALVLAGQPGLVRGQVLVVVAVAGAIEVVCSPILGVYLYRFHNVPLYVPPAHGLVYLAALSFGRTAILRSCARPATLAVLGLGTAWAVWGLAVSTRADVLGAFWFGCLVVFLARDRTRLLFVAAFAVVGYLELLGTSLGVWTWQAHDPMGFVGIGNPPSGIAGGYGWFDVAAMLLAPRLITFWRRPTSQSADRLRQAAAARSRLRADGLPSHSARTTARAAQASDDARPDVGRDDMPSTTRASIASANHSTDDGRTPPRGTHESPGVAAGASMCCRRRRTRPPRGPARVTQ